ncbi:MAG TPA: hypothetical protein VN428_13730 [Bryobacteraceae bacterium]|nr:hypothetical protein [Bryobacteraceae bacterium]
MIRRTVCVFLFAAAVMMAGDWTGKWSGTMETVKGGPGAPPVDDHFLVLKQEGASVTGTAGPRATAQWEIQNVRAEGDKLTFDSMPPGGVFVLGYELTLKDGVITGRVASKKGPPMEGNLTFKRGN